MEILQENSDLSIIIHYLIETAKKSTCHRSKCGSVVISLKKRQFLGMGYNSMPGNCVGECFKETLPSNFKSDKTCCVHAEQRAIMDALKYKNENGDALIGSYLFFIRLDENDQPKHSGAPYCSICSKMALDVGISKFVLWHKEGWTAYDIKKYNDLTFQYNGDS